MLRCNYDKKFLARINLLQFNKEILQHFLELKTSYYESFAHQEFVLFNNKDILVDGCSIFYKTWFEKDVDLIQDLLDADGKVISYAKFTEKYFLSCNFMTYTPNANMADHSVGVRDESNGNEASEALMFCFDNAFPEKCCVVVDLVLLFRPPYAFLCS